MASSAPIKIYPKKLSFFDLPREVRDKIVEEYFGSGEVYGIHLLGDAEGKKSFQSSTSFQLAFSSKTWDYRVHGIMSGRLEVRSVEPLNLSDLVTQCSSPALRDCPLGIASRDLYIETQGHRFRDHLFVFLGRESGPIRRSPNQPLHSYHTDIRVIDQVLLAQIINLELPGHTIDHIFSGYIDKEGWAGSNWTSLLTRTVSLRNLTLSGLDPQGLRRFITLLTRKTALFLDERPKVNIELSVVQLYDPFGMPAIRSNAPRFIVTPLVSLAVHSMASMSLFEGPDAIDVTEWHGSRFRRTRVRSDPVFKDPSCVRTDYEIEWS